MASDDDKLKEWANEITSAKIPHGEWAKKWADNGYEWRRTVKPLEDCQVRDVRTCIQEFQYPSLTPYKHIMTLQHQCGMLVRIDGEQQPLPKGANLFLRDFHPSDTPTNNILQTVWFCSRPEPKKSDLKFIMASLGGGGCGGGDFA